MLIRKYPNGNEYLRADNTWVRNFTKENFSPKEINKFFNKNDYGLIYKNEQINQKFPKISDEKLVFKKIVIISDGYKFDEKHLFLGKLPKDVCVLAVNNALKKWKLLSEETLPENKRTINGYVINNPYKEALNFLPYKNSLYFPACISSTRTNLEFTKKYKGDVYVYKPSSEQDFGFDSNESYHIEDYRNPICAAIMLAYQFGVEKLMLACCDDSFEDKRDAAIELKNGLYTYEPLLKSQSIIDAVLYWLTHQEDRKVSVSDYSAGVNYQNAQYITNEENACSFFEKNMEGF